VELEPCSVCVPSQVETAGNVQGSSGLLEAKLPLLHLRELPGNREKDVLQISCFPNNWDEWTDY